MKHTSKLLGGTALAALLGLAACSGGSDGGSDGGSNAGPGPGNSGSPNAQSDTVPDSAGVSGAAFISFLKSLGANDETSEPLQLKDSFAVPSDETGDPESLG
jgi:hypothetical protein